MSEVWKDISGYEGKYQVSNTGKVRSLDYNHTGKVRELKLKIDKYGYACIKLFKNGCRKYITVHRLVAAAFIKNTSNSPQVNHKDGNKLNNCVQNLEWCSNKENIQHGRKMGLFNKALKASIERRKSVLCIKKTSGMIFAFPSFTHAGYFIGATASEISEVFHGHRCSTHGFFVI